MDRLFSWGGACAAKSMGTTLPAGVDACPSFRRTSPSTNSDESKPQAGQTNRTGLMVISGVSSKANFAPQEHCTFISDSAAPHLESTRAKMLRPPVFVAHDRHRTARYHRAYRDYFQVACR